MKLEQFFGKYANTPIEERTELVVLKNGRPITLIQAYFTVKKLNDEIREKQSAQEELIEACEKLLNKK